MSFWHQSADENARPRYNIRHYKRFSQCNRALGGYHDPFFDQFDLYGTFDADYLRLFKGADSNDI
jgi:hypothetical protein